MDIEAIERIITRLNILSDAMIEYAERGGLGPVGCKSISRAIREVRESVTDATGITSR